MLLFFVSGTLGDSTTGSHRVVGDVACNVIEETQSELLRGRSTPYAAHEAERAAERSPCCHEHVHRAANDEVATPADTLSTTPPALILHHLRTQAQEAIVARVFLDEPLGQCKHWAYNR